MSDHDICGFGAEALVIVNSESFGAKLLSALWQGAKIRICADGGANRLYNISGESLIPDAIVGDLDSAESAVLDVFKGHGTILQRVEDQDRNDLDKAMEYLTTKLQKPSVAVLGAFGGRLDQEMASFDIAFRWQEHTKSIDLFSNENAATLLAPGHLHRIRYRPALEGPSCGLIPIAGKCDSVTTTGLKWNLQEQPLEFGKLVSTSNQVRSTSSRDQPTLVSVFSSHPLLWTTEFQAERLPHPPSK